MSCRRGIKDGDCGCCKSLAAKVRELYQRCANAIKSINGINPDGANNFDILAGAGIQVNPRANGIEIESLIDDSDKVDKLDTAGDYAYTHSGATQGETPIEDGITADTIPIRDANGRMQAADPASGATDKTLVTANWISQTGDSSPNNLIHRAGNETKSGKLVLAWNSNSNQFAVKRPTNEYNVAPGGNIYSSMLFTDKNDETCGSVNLGHYTNGHNELYLGVRSQTGKYAYLQLRIRPDDTGYLRLTKPDGTSIDIVTW